MKFQTVLLIALAVAGIFADQAPDAGAPPAPINGSATESAAGSATGVNATASSTAGSTADVIKTSSSSSGSGSMASDNVTFPIGAKNSTKSPAPTPKKSAAAPSAVVGSAVAVVALTAAYFL